MEGSNGIVKHIAHITPHISWKLLSACLTVKKSITFHSDPEGRKDIVLQCAKRYKEACELDRDGDRWKPKLAPDGDNVQLRPQVLQPIPSQEHKLAAKVKVVLKTLFTEGLATIFTFDIVNANRKRFKLIHQLTFCHTSSGHNSGLPRELRWMGNLLWRHLLLAVLSCTCCKRPLYIQHAAGTVCSVSVLCTRNSTYIYARVRLWKLL